MNLVGYTATALSRNDIEDTPTNKNVVDFAIVELKDLQGNLVVMYDDAEGANPETQKTCDTNGQCTFFAEAGDYNLEINGKAQRINLAANIADYIKLGTGESVQEFADSFALKIFQSPTDGGLTEIQTRTVNANEVYEVRKVSDDSLATIYSDAAGTTEIMQNGTDNKSGSDGIVKFYTSDGDYYITANTVRGNFKVVAEIRVTWVTLEEFGGGGGGSFDNTAALIAIKSKSSSAVVRLLKDEVYFFAGNRPDLTGVRWYQEDNARIKVSANPNIKEMELLTNLTVENTAHNTVTTKGVNKNLNPTFNAAASINRDYSSKFEYVSFNDCELVSIDSANSITAFTGTDLEYFIKWDSSFDAGQKEGALLPVQHGVLYECAVRSIAAASGSVSVAALASSGRVELSVSANSTDMVVKTAAGTVIATIPSKNGQAFGLFSNSSCTLGVRVNGKIAELYVNSVLIYKHELSSFIEKVGFLVDSTQATDTNLLDITKTKSVPSSSRQKKVTIVGDSISYGAWSANSYDKILKDAFQVAGMGALEVQNVAVSGSSSGNWKVGGTIGIENIDLSDSDYCFVMLGTNDVQGSGVNGAQTLHTNMVSIVNYIKASGVIPVLGVPPIWTDAAVSGKTGVAATNYQKAGWARQKIRKFSSLRNVPIADVCAKFGDNINWIDDNVHPSQTGLTAVAASFCEAIIDVESGNKSTNLEYQKLTTQDSWTPVSGSDVSFTKDSNTIAITGRVTGGAVSSYVTILPSGYRPRETKTFLVWCNDSGGTGGFGRIDVQANGGVFVNFASVTPFILSLDGINFIV